MKYLDKFINYIFSVLALVLSVIIVMVATGFIEFNVFCDYMKK